MAPPAPPTGQLLASEVEGDFDKRQIPVSPEKLRRHPDRPDTPWQALMECKPGDEPELSKVELLPLREIIAEALAGLTPREQWVFERWAIERMSFAEIGRMTNLSKSMAHKIYHQSRRKLMTALQHEPLVQSHIMERG